MPPCHGGGQGFKSPSGRHFAFVAQLVEQGTENPRVSGSIPLEGTICKKTNPCHSIGFDKDFFVLPRRLTGAEVDIENFRHRKKEQPLFRKEGKGIDSLKLKGTQIVALQEFLPVFVRVANG